jgi:VanZ family protein
LVRSTRGALLIATIASAALVLAAPFIGQIRAAIQSAFPAYYVLILRGSIAVALVAAVGTAIARIRAHRTIRFGAIVLAVALAATYSLVTATGNREVDAVERVHFVEYGLIAVLFYRVWRTSGDPSAFVLPLMSGFIVGTLDEWLQWFIPVRVGEAHDVFLNLVALAGGVMFGAAVWPPVPWSPRLRQVSFTRVGRLGAVTVLVFAGFFSSVHLGRVVHIDGVGDFRSHYSSQQLEADAADRAIRWRQNPPIVLRRLSREDQYLDEGLWHIRRRNELWTAGDIPRAWRENLILERFFAPVLDTPSYASPAVNRWPSEQRTDAEARASQLAEPFVSDAQVYPLYPWPRWIFLTSSFLAAAALGYAPRKWNVKDTRASAGCRPELS